MWENTDADGEKIVTRYIIAMCKRCGVEPFAWFRDAYRASPRTPCIGSLNYSRITGNLSKFLPKPDTRCQFAAQGGSRAAYHQTLTMDRELCRNLRFLTIRGTHLTYSV